MDELVGFVVELFDSSDQVDTKATGLTDGAIEISNDELLELQENYRDLCKTAESVLEAINDPFAALVKHCAEETFSMSESLLAEHFDEEFAILEDLKVDQETRSAIMDYVISKTTGEMLQSRDNLKPILPDDLAEVTANLKSFRDFVCKFHEIDKKEKRPRNWKNILRSTALAAKDVAVVTLDTATYSVPDVTTILYIKGAYSIVAGSRSLKRHMESIGEELN